MIKTENKLQEIEVIKDIFCNKCGNSCMADDKSGFVFAELQVHWGYGSLSHDGEVHLAHLCESCWENITKDFKHSDLIAVDQF